MKKSILILALGFYGCASNANREFASNDKAPLGSIKPKILCDLTKLNSKGEYVKVAESEPLGQHGNKYTERHGGPLVDTEKKKIGYDISMLTKNEDLMRIGIYEVAEIWDIGKAKKVIAIAEGPADSSLLLNTGGFQIFCDQAE